MQKFHAQKPNSNIRTMDSMLLENRVLTVSRLKAWNNCIGKWAVSLQYVGKSNFFTLKAIGNEDGFSQKIKTIPIGENARMVRTSDMEFGMKIEPGEVVTPLEKSPFAVIYSPLLFDKKEHVARALNRKPVMHKPLTPRIVEHPLAEPAHQHRA